MAPGAGGEPVRLRIGTDRYALVPSYRPDPRGTGPPAGPVRDLTRTTPEFTRTAPESPRPHRSPGALPMVALIEAVPAGGDALAAAAAATLEAAGLRPGIVSLDRHNRLATRFGCPDPAPVWRWQQAAPDLPVDQGCRVVVPGPAAEAGLDGPAAAAVLQHLAQMAAALIIDLGCRWEPRLFRPVLTMATHIWIITRAGQWSGAEMRLEQAEFSGFTPMERVRLVVIGDGLPPPGFLGAPVAAVLPAAEGAAVQEFIWREIGRGLS
jgi:hypothetical protein